MPQADPVTSEELVATLIAKIKTGDANALGFNALLKERAAEQWNDLRKEAIDGFVEKKVQEAMKGYYNRVWQVAGMVGVAALLLWGTRLYNMTQSPDIAAQIIMQLKDNEDSPVSKKLKEILEDFNNKKGQAENALSEVSKKFEETKEEAIIKKEALKNTQTIIEEIGKISDGLATIRNDAVALSNSIDQTEKSLNELSEVKRKFEDFLKNKFSNLSETDKKTIMLNLSSLISSDEVLLSKIQCDDPYQEVVNFSYKGITDNAQKFNAYVCLSNALRKVSDGAEVKN